MLTPDQLAEIEAHDYRPDRNGADAYRQSDLAAVDVPALLDAVRQLTEDRDRARAEVDQFKPQPMSQRCRDGHHNGVGDQACLNCWCLCHNAEAEAAEALAAYRDEVTRLIEQRDQAREIAVALEQESARLRNERDRAYSALSEYGRSAVDISGDLEDGINAEHLMAQAERGEGA